MKVKKSDSLLIVNYGDINVPVFLYPLIQEREAANTRVVTAGTGIDIDNIDYQNYRFVLTFKGSFANPDYKPVYRYYQELGKMGDETNEAALFERTYATTIDDLFK
jgi:hypothetical protein